VASQDSSRTWSGSRSSPDPRRSPSAKWTDASWAPTAMYLPSGLHATRAWNLPGEFLYGILLFGAPQVKLAVGCGREDRFAWLHWMSAMVLDVGVFADHRASGCHRRSFLPARKRGYSRSDTRRRARPRGPAKSSITVAPGRRDVFHRRTLASWPAEARCSPSADQATHDVPKPCPDSCSRSWRYAASRARSARHRRGGDQIARRRPSERNHVAIDRGLPLLRQLGAGEANGLGEA